MKRDKRENICIFGNFGTGNLGNESTLQAVLENIRVYLPKANVTCICTGPQTCASIYNITSIAMHPLFIRPDLLQNNLLSKLIRKIFLGVSLELFRLFKIFKTLSNKDFLIVPGTQFLSDTLSGPFGNPYLIFKWSVLSKLVRCKLVFLSVGVGPIIHPLSRLFIKASLLFANYRSYRDNFSRQYLLSIGFSSKKDQIYPDLAFGLPFPPVSTDIPSHRERPVVAVGVLDYHGQFSSKHPEPKSVIYNRYIQKTVAFVSWLLEHSYSVHLVLGDLSYDPSVQSDIISSLSQRQVSTQNLQIAEKQIESFEKLVLYLAACDIIVSPRYHNVVFGLLVNKPVIALAYQEKFSALLEDFDLARYCLNIDHFDANTLIDRFIEIKKYSSELMPSIMTKVKEYRLALDEQYKRVFEVA